MPRGDRGNEDVAGLIDLRGRCVVVTGAAKGIGAAIATRLAEAGGHVVLTDVDTAVEGAADELTGRGLSVCWRLCDVTNTEELVAAAASAGDRLDVWINNAGIYPTTGPVLDVTDEFLIRLFDLNIRAQYSAAREAARRMTAGGAIVNLASIAALRGGFGVSAYATSKAALAGMTRALANDLGPMSIRVNAIAPGIIDTPGVRAEMEPLRAQGLKIGQALAANPLGLTGQPDYVARAALFLASDLAAFVTGHLLVVDGGLTA